MEFDEGEFVKAQGRLQIYNGRSQFVVETIRRVMLGPDSQGFDNWSNARGQSNDWRVDATWNPGSDGFLKELSFGVRLAERKASTSS